MLIYSIALATAGDVTTNASGGTENNTWAMKAGTRNVALQSLYVIGKANALTAISGIALRVVSFLTIGTAGTGITPNPKDPGFQAAKATITSAATTGTGTRLNHLSFGCGAAGPGGWVAPNPDSLLVVQGGTAGIPDLECLNVSNTASLKFEWSGEIVE